MVILREVVSGNGVIGEMDRTIVHVADDDVYPAKVPRDMRKQKRSAKEILVQSSNQSDCFLTVLARTRPPKAPPPSTYRLIRLTFVKSERSRRCMQAAFSNCPARGT